MKSKSMYPILIPTLDRYEHFKKCIESLANNTHANKTELVIGLDYPPSEKYMDGYMKIKEYIPEICGFNKITVIMHNHNVGAAGNMKYLRDYAFKHYDACISTEDDNIFSPCFLDFMNKALCLYSDNPEIQTVSGYNGYNITSENYKLLLTSDCCAWGLGIWKKKEMQFDNIEYSWYKKIILNFYQTFSLYLKYPAGAMMLLYCIRNGYKYGDVFRTIYNIGFNYYQLRPMNSLVRNEGFDGSGLHCGLDEFGLHNINLDDASVFDFDNKIMCLTESIKGKKILFRHALPVLFKQRLFKHISFWYSYLKYKILHI